MKLGDIKNNTTTEVEGVWMAYGGGMEIKLARMSNPKFEEYLRKLLRPFRSKVADNSIADDTIEEMTNKALARYVLLNWKGLEDDEGTEVPYSEKKALELLSDKDFRDFNKDVQRMSMDRTAYRQEGIDDESGN